MSKFLILFAAWCLLLSTGALAAAYYGWSPYADASGRRESGTMTAHGGYGGGHFYGPMHK